MDLIRESFLHENPASDNIDSCLITGDLDAGGGGCRSGADRVYSGVGREQRAIQRHAIGDVFCGVLEHID